MGIPVGDNSLIEALLTTDFLSNVPTKIHPALHSKPALTRVSRRPL